MPARNTSADKGASRSRNEYSRPEGYAHGNSNWNTSNYKQSVRTSRTDTRVINSGAPGSKKKGYYYDNTPAAVKARQKKRFEEKRREWEKTVRKNVRGRKIRTSTVLALSLLAALVVVFGIIYRIFFVTTDVTVSGYETYSEQQIKDASGLTPTTHLYSFSSKALGEKVSFACPRIYETDVDRTIPNKVSLAVSEEKPVYYTEIYGENYMLSASLRLLEKTTFDEARALGLGRLKVKKVESAVSGGKLTLCSERAQRYLENTVTLVNDSELFGRITNIDMSDEFKLTMVVDGKYKLEFGTQEEMDIKVRLACAVLKDSMFESGNKAYIDLTDTAKTSVIVDNQLVLD